ncbi:hypothetical protein J1614_007192 [Plenodomus biglobosus]|nr:hypothetical protein J1614_007192 [Plenodomus biglobosus]
MNRNISTTAHLTSGRVQGHDTNQQHNQPRAPVPVGTMGIRTIQNTLRLPDGRTRTQTERTTQTYMPGGTIKSVTEVFDGPSLGQYERPVSQYPQPRRQTQPRYEPMAPYQERSGRVRESMRQSEAPYEPYGPTAPYQERSGRVRESMRQSEAPYEPYGPTAPYQERSGRVRESTIRSQAMSLQQQPLEGHQPSQPQSPTHMNTPWSQPRAIQQPLEYTPAQAAHPQAEPETKEEYIQQPWSPPRTTQRPLEYSPAQSQIELASDEEHMRTTTESIPQSEPEAQERYVSRIEIAPRTAPPTTAAAAAPTAAPAKQKPLYQLRKLPAPSVSEAASPSMSKNARLAEMPRPSASEPKYKLRSPVAIDDTATINLSDQNPTEPRAKASTKASSDKSKQTPAKVSEEPPTTSANVIGRPETSVATNPTSGHSELDSDSDGGIALEGSAATPPRTEPLPIERPAKMGSFFYTKSTFLGPSNAFQRRRPVTKAASGSTTSTVKPPTDAAPPHVGPDQLDKEADEEDVLGKPRRHTRGDANF